MTEHDAFYYHRGQIFTALFYLEKPVVVTYKEKTGKNKVKIIL